MATRILAINGGYAECGTHLAPIQASTCRDTWEYLIRQIFQRVSLWTDQIFSRLVATGGKYSYLEKGGEAAREKASRGAALGLPINTGTRN